ncbi:LysR family transcriptional regulator [Edwardsiella piscicida]|nr:LysR family transcriptional regulator [Edwardsiella piscicida]AOP44843.1 LysR family transcriptional regulator [Edwardsiella piscicida]ARD20090.1 transcriptional regulator [Edwardsiella piscicida]EKS7767831.1 LysR family transcriptional regulator [Edwardsiella piscicida]EKS7781430.1 LysR family transcriptional regulator [Edwardsiella piscicida]EKS7784666.1 LysR family transcriptional regulator [Edwardsiella piscicida]
MLDVDVSVIRTFLTVMDTRSVTLAAELLDSSTASISRALKKMRDAFNDPLFIRTKQGLEPTALAYNITPNLAQALNNIQNAANLTNGIHQGDRRQTRLKLSMSPLLEFYLTRLLQHYHYPFDSVALMTETHDGDLTRDISRLRSRKIDISFTPQKYADWMITNVPVFDVQPAVLCRVGHPRIGPGFTLDQLAQEDYLSLTMWPSLFEDDEVLNPHRKAPIYSSSSLLNLMMMVASSDYILLCGKRFAQEFARLVEIQVLDHPQGRSMGTIYAHYHKSRTTDPCIIELIDILRTRAGE